MRDSNPLDMFFVCSFHQGMQYALPFDPDNRLVRIHEGLLAAFGRPPKCHRLDPVSQLVLTMLSARTRSPIAKAAFKRLANRFSRWEELARTPARKLRRLIEPVTYAESKAMFLPGALLNVMRRRGDLSLDFLNAWPAGAAQAWLETLPGVGPKTSAAILNFSPLHKPVLVVDTAHYRAAQRLGLISANASLAKAARILVRHIPDHWTADDIEDHHFLMQTLGQSYCTHSNPACGDCPIRQLCFCAP